MAQEIASFYATISADTKDFDKGLKDTKEGMSALGKTTDAIGGAAKLAMGVGVAAVAGFGAVIGKSVGSAMDFQQGVTDIGATMSLTADETAKLQDHIMDLGLDPKLKVSASEASQGIMALGTAGLSLEQIMGGASKATVQLSNATGGPMADSASLMTDLMGQFNITAGDTSKIVDQVTGLTVASKFAFEDVALAFGQVGGVAGSVGLSLEDTSAILGVTAKNFNSGADAATSMKTMLTTLIPKSSEAEDVMASLGLVTTDYTRMASDLSKVIGQEVQPTFMGVEEAFKKTKAGTDAAAVSNTALAKAFTGLKAQYQENQFFDDTTGQMKSASEIAGVLQGAFSGLSEEQKLEAASTIFGNDAMRTAFGLIDAGTPGITKMKDEIAKVDAGSIAAKRMDTFSGAMEIAQGIIETLAIQVGQKFLPVLRPLIEAFSTLAQTYGPMVVDFFGSLADTIGGALAGVSSVVNQFQKALEGGATASEALYEALSVLVPDDLIDTFTAVWDGIGAIIDIIKSAYRPIADQIGKWVKWQDVLVAVGLLVAGPLLGALGALVAAFAPVLAVMAAVIAAVALLRNAWETNFFGIRDIAKSTWNSIKDVIGSTLDSIGSWLRIHTGIWKGDWSKTLQYLFEHGSDAWSNIYDSVTGYVHDIVREARHEFDVWLEKLDLWVRLTETNFMVWKNNTLGAIREWAHDIVVNYFQPVLDWWHDHIQPWVDAGRDLILGLWDGIRRKWYDMTDWFHQEWEDLQRNFKNFFGIHSPSKLFAGFGENISLGLAEGIGNAHGAVDSAMSGLSMGVTNTAMNSMVAMPSSTPTSPDTVLLQRSNQLLEMLIQELRAKNMTANVTVRGGGGGMGLGDMVGMKAGLS